MTEPVADSARIADTLRYGAPISLGGWLEAHAQRLKPRSVTSKSGPTRISSARSWVGRISELIFMMIPSRNTSISFAAPRRCWWLTEARSNGFTCERATYFCSLRMSGIRPNAPKRGVFVQ